VGAGAWGRGAAGAVTQCERSLIADWRVERCWFGGAIWGSGRFAICEERSWSSSFRALLSLERLVSFGVIPASSCEMVTSRLTRSERMMRDAVSDGISSDRVSRENSGRSRVLP